MLKKKRQIIQKKNGQRTPQAITKKKKKEKYKTRCWTAFEIDRKLIQGIIAFRLAKLRKYKIPFSQVY